MALNNTRMSTHKRIIVSMFCCVLESSKQIPTQHRLSQLLVQTRPFAKAQPKDSVSLTQVTVPRLLLTAVSVYRVFGVRQSFQRHLSAPFQGPCFVS
jgi:malonyl CoA-acyl carrier protein transacylase